MKELRWNFRKLFSDLGGFEEIRRTMEVDLELPAPSDSTFYGIQQRGTCSASMLASFAEVMKYKGIETPLQEYTAELSNG